MLFKRVVKVIFLTKYNPFVKPLPYAMEKLQNTCKLSKNPQSRVTLVLLTPARRLLAVAPVRRIGHCDNQEETLFSHIGDNL